MQTNLKTFNLQDIQPKEINWLWHPYIPAGKLTIVQGDPGEGKTTMVLSVAAGITTGIALPNGNPTEPANVIFQTAEDGYADTIRPRLEMFSADLSRVHAIDEDEQPLSLTDARIEEAIIRFKAKLLVLDPLQAYLGGRNMNTANGVRPLMKALGDVAERTGCAIVIIGHLNKSGSKAQYRGLGSTDIPAAARSVLTVGRIDELTRAFVQTKSNLAPSGKPQAFRLDPTAGFMWLGDISITADELLNNKKTDRLESQLEKAMRLISIILQNGAELADAVVSSVEAEGVSRKTIKRAKKALNVRSFKRGEPWYWELPIGDRDTDDGQVGQVVQESQDAHTDLTVADETMNHMTSLTSLNHLDVSVPSTLQPLKTNEDEATVVEPLPVLCANDLEFNRIYNVDCIIGMQKLASESIDAIITDPPFNISRKNNFHTMNGRAGLDFGEWDRDFDLTGWLEVALPKLKPGGNIVIFNDWKNMGLIASYLAEHGCLVKDFIQWRKTNPQPRNTDRRYVGSCEYAIWATKGEDWTFNKQREGYENGIFEYPVVHNIGRIHKTQKPVALIEDLIRIHTNTGQVILDPFMGSATTAVAAINTQRRFIGFELDKNYYNLAFKRITEDSSVPKPSDVLPEYTTSRATTTNVVRLGRHQTLRAASVNKKDEFYTQLADIEKELCHYTMQFKDKHMYCNCDNPYTSNFVRYFVENFEQLGLSKLTATCFCDSNNQIFIGDEITKLRPYKAVFTGITADVDFDVALERAEVSELFGNGDFRSDECVELLKEADIVVTNPPFSLFKDFIELMTKHDKQFIVIGNTNALILNSVFGLFKANKLRIGYTNYNKGMYFRIPDDYTAYTKEVDGVKYAQVVASCWYTNLAQTKSQVFLQLTQTYDPLLHQTYHNYDAVNVDRVKDIPCDYDGFMGVPITFLPNFNPEQFELHGILCGTQFSEIKPTREYKNAFQVDMNGVRKQKHNLNINPMLLMSDKPKGTHYIADGVDGYLVSRYARVQIKRRA